MSAFPQQQHGYTLYPTETLYMLSVEYQPASAPGTADGQVSTVKTEGSGWSNATALSGQKRARSYLYGA